MAGLSACSDPQQRLVTELSGQPTTFLCSRHMVATGAELLAVEAELGARDSLQCETSYGSMSYVGSRTVASVGRPSYTREATTQSSANEKNCSDFATSGAAQRFFLLSGGPHRDPNGLDRDGDGNACEWGETLRASVTRYKPKATVRATPRYTSSACYVGPRGGRYTLTASGRKNYGGC